MAQSTRKTLPDLPREIITRIVEVAKDPREYQSNFELDAEDRPGNEDFPFYKSLRLTTRLFRQIATPLLFEVVVLYNHAGSWSSLNSIALSTLAPCVKTIVLSTVLQLAPNADYDTKDEWCHATAHMRGIGGLLQTQPPDGGPHSRIDFGNASECYARYTYWRDGEQVMSQHLENGTAPDLALHLLVKLKCIQMANHKGLASIRVRADRGSEGYEDAQDLTRREVESCCRDTESATWDGDAHLKLFTIAQERSDATIPCFVFENPYELTDKGHNAPARIPSLRRLEFNLQSLLDGNLEMVIFRNPGIYPLSQWIHSLYDLEELSIFGSTCTFFILQRLIAVPLPSLKKLTLQGVLIDYPYLETFLNQHWSTLKYVQVRDPVDQYSDSNGDFDYEFDFEEGKGEEEEEEALILDGQVAWDHYRRCIEEKAGSMGVRVDLSEKLVSVPSLREDSRYKQCLAF